MSKYSILNLICILGIFASTNCIGQTQPVGPQTKLYVGTYDSRAVALAYWHSNMSKIKEFSGKLRSQLNKARAAGETQKAKEIAAEGKAMQTKMHKQVFGNAPIREIIKEIEKKLPAIAQKANVDIIINLWDVAYQSSSTQFVDVTDSMVALFSPSAKTLKMIKELRRHSPVPKEKLDKMD